MTKKTPSTSAATSPSSSTADQSTERKAVETSDLRPSETATGVTGTATTKSPVPTPAQTGAPDPSGLASEPVSTASSQAAQEDKSAVKSNSATPSNFQSIVRRAPSLAQLSTTVSRLVNDQEDIMELHTREAMMLFLGRDSGEDRRFGVPGARHAAGSLRQLFVLTARDNPYADMVLIEVDRRAKLIREKISEHRARQFNKLEALKRMGLSYSVVRAQVPQSVNLGYYSPYGYTMSTLIVLYDECVRVLKSAERRDLISRTELHDALFDMKHSIRSLFDMVLKAQRTLCNDNMRPLSRTDYVPDRADLQATKRVQAAQQILGQLPEDVFAGRVAPRHSMRRERISEAEQRLLDDLARQINEPAALPGSSAESANGLID